MSIFLKTRRFLTSQTMSGPCRPGVKNIVEGAPALRAGGSRSQSGTILQRPSGNCQHLTMRFWLDGRAQPQFRDHESQLRGIASSPCHGWQVAIALQHCAHRMCPLACPSSATKSANSIREEHRCCASAACSAYTLASSGPRVLGYAACLMRQGSRIRSYRRSDRRFGEDVPWNIRSLGDLPDPSGLRRSQNRRRVSRKPRRTTPQRHREIRADIAEMHDGGERDHAFDSVNREEARRWRACDARRDHEVAQLRGHEDAAKPMSAAQLTNTVCETASRNRGLQSSEPANSFIRSGRL